MTENCSFNLDIPVQIENINSVLAKRSTANISSMKELTQSNLPKSHKVVSDHLRIIESFPTSSEILEAEDTKSDVALLPNIKDTIKNEPLSVVCDLQTFLSPLEQDYTKSGKGYTCQSKSDEKLNTTSSNILNDVEVDDSDELSVLKSDGENDDQSYKSIISRHFYSLHDSSSESEISVNDDSDSDYCIVFSDNFVEGTQEANSENFNIDKYKKINNIFSIRYDSDCSDDDDNDNEQSNYKYVKTKSKETIKSICDSKKELSDSESSDDDCLFQNHEGTDSSLLFQSFDLSFTVNNKEFSGISYSLSQSKMCVYPSDFEGFINPCFEDDFSSHEINLRAINDKWESTMQDVSNEPREPKRISFLPLPDLVSIQTFEPDDDGYKYSVYVLDQIRFKNRIQEFEEILKPYLTPEHRANVYKSFHSSK